MPMKKKILAINSDRVLEAAKECKTAQKVLEKLFPEVFEDEKSVDLSKLSACFAKTAFSKAGLPANTIEVRVYNEFKDKGFFLTDKYTWTLVTDTSGIQVLIPSRRVTDDTE